MKIGARGLRIAHLRLAGLLIAMAMSILASSTRAEAASCAVPNSISNGQVADATAVMGNFNALANCLNNTVQLTGLPASAGQLSVFSGPNTITTGNLSGDCVTTGTLAVTCTKSNGAPLSYFATGTDAGQLTGTVSVNRFNNGVSADSDHFLRGDGMWAIPSAGSGSGHADPLFPDTSFTAPRIATFTLVKDAAVTATAADTTRGIDLAVTGAGAADRNAMLERNTPAATFTMTAMFVMNAEMRRYMTAGLYIRDSATDHILTGGLGSVTAGAASIFRVTKWNTRTSFNSDFVGAAGAPTGFTPVWVKLQVDATNLTISLSGDGEFWEPIYAAPKNAWVANIDRCGLWFGVNQTDAPGSGTVEHLHLMAFTLG